MLINCSIILEGAVFCCCMILIYCSFIHPYNFLWSECLCWDLFSESFPHSLHMQQTTDQVFEPVRVYVRLDGLYLALVSMPPGSLPWFGSVKPKQPRISPRAVRDRHYNPGINQELSTTEPKYHTMSQSVLTRCCWLIRNWWQINIVLLILPSLGRNFCFCSSVP